MTSKEALERLRNNTIEAGNKIAKSKGIKNREIVKTVTANGETLIIYPKEELNIIEKDLRVLETLKNKIKIDEDCCYMSDPPMYKVESFYVGMEDSCLIHNWLERK